MIGSSPIMTVFVGRYIVKAGGGRNLIINRGQSNVKFVLCVQGKQLNVYL